MLELVPSTVRRTHRRPGAKGVMPRLRWPLLFVVLPLTACGGSGGEGGDEADEGPDAELVAWMGDFCEARSTLLELPSPLPRPDVVTEADRQPLLTFLADVDAALAAADEAVVALPDPPVAAGNDLVDSYRADLDEFRSEMAEHAVDAASFPPEGLQAVYRLSSVGVVSFSPGGEELSDYLEGRDDLTEAYQEATDCP